MKNDNLILKLIVVVILSLLAISSTPILNAKSNIEAIENFNECSLIFIENKGQLIDSEGNLRSDIAYVSESNGVKLYFIESGVSYVFTKEETDGVNNNLYPKKFEDKYLNRNDREISKITTYRMDMELWELIIIKICL